MGREIGNRASQVGTEVLDSARSASQDFRVCLLDEIVRLDVPAADHRREAPQWRVQLAEHPDVSRPHSSSTATHPPVWLRHYFIDARRVRIVTAISAKPWDSVAAPLA